MSVPREAQFRLVSLLAVVAGTLLLMGAGPRPENKDESSAARATLSVPPSAALTEFLKRLATDDPSSPLNELEGVEEAEAFNANSYRPWLLER